VAVDVSSSGASEVTGLGLEQVVGGMPAAVVVIEAPSGRIAYANAAAREMMERLGRAIPDELSADWEIYRPDGRPSLMRTGRSSARSPPGRRSLTRSTSKSSRTAAA
jgi:PAS domain-containing protein